MNLSRRVALGLLASLPLVGRKAFAASALMPSAGPVILEIEGAISQTNAYAKAHFDRAMLVSLDWVEVESNTSYTDGPQQFAGPTLASLLEAVGAHGETLFATAINDYTVEIPIAHAQRHRVILAMHLNGAPMRVRDKGPIWIVYPMDADEVVENPFDSRMIWQLAHLRVQ